jgi:hypothetical protein
MGRKKTRLGAERLFLLKKPEWEGPILSAPAILAVRVVISVLFALFIAYFFFRNTSVFLVTGLSIALFGLAYLLEYLRKRSESEDS